MSDSAAGVIAAVIGLGALLAFTATSRHQTTSKISGLIGLLMIPLAVAVLWRLALVFGWWTILLFVLTSLVVGVCNAVLMRKAGAMGLYGLQAPLGIAAVCAIGISWLLR